MGKKIYKKLIQNSIQLIQNSTRQANAQFLTDLLMEIDTEVALLVVIVE